MNSPTCYFCSPLIFPHLLNKLMIVRALTHYFYFACLQDVYHVWLVAGSTISLLVAYVGPCLMFLRLRYWEQRQPTIHSLVAYITTLLTLTLPPTRARRLFFRYPTRESFTFRRATGIDIGCLLLICGALIAVIVLCKENFGTLVHDG